MTIKSYLSQVKHLQKLIEQQIMTINEIKNSYQKLTSQINDMPRGGLKSDLSDIVIKFDEEIEHLKELVRQQSIARGRIIYQINELKPEYSLILHCYYINGMTIEEMAEYMNVSYKTLWDKKEEAEEAFFKKYNKII